MHPMHPYVLIAPSSAAGADYPQTHHMSPSSMLAACVLSSSVAMGVVEEVGDDGAQIMSRYVTPPAPPASVTWSGVRFERKMYVSPH